MKEIYRQHIKKGGRVGEGSRNVQRANPLRFAVGHVQRRWPAAPGPRAARSADGCLTRLRSVTDRGAMPTSTPQLPGAMHTGGVRVRLLSREALGSVAPRDKPNGGGSCPWPQPQLRRAARRQPTFRRRSTDHGRHGPCCARSLVAGGGPSGRRLRRFDALLRRCRATGFPVAAHSSAAR